MGYQLYLQLLQPWVRASREYLHRPVDRSELAFYGSGTDRWGVQTNQKALGAFSCLAVEPDLDERAIGMSREEILDYALSMLRFCLSSHIEGDYRCTDGNSWGHTWISALGIERMMHGVDAIEDYLTEEDKALLKRVLTSESDWILDHYPIVAGPVEDNKPESNLWNGAILHRTAAMYPDSPRADEYREKGSRFLINSISIPEDAVSTQILDGRPISDWYIGNNFFSSYALNHHRYLNVGYMVICLSNVAMLHFMYRNNGIEPPEALYHHVDELWQLVKTCLFPDGRLIRIGGDTRVRYCYCQDYLIPALLMIEDRYGDIDCRDFEKGWLDLVRREQDYNGDGSFLSDRGEKVNRASPLYYTRLESDRAVTLSMGLYWRRTVDLAANEKVLESKLEFPTLNSWKDNYHGACLHRGENRIASWVWESAERPQGLCLSPEHSDMAEWHLNLAGKITGMGFVNKNRVKSHREILFEGGFLTFGEVILHSQMFVAEGEIDRDIASQTIVFAALPDDSTVLVMQCARALNWDYFSSIKGLHLQMPNDIFNGNSRTYYTEAGSMEIEGGRTDEEKLNLQGPWLNIDDCLTLIKCYGDSPISIYRPGTRQIQIRDRFPDTGNLYVDEICCPCEIDVQSKDRGERLFDIGFILRVGEGHGAAREYSRVQDNLWATVDSPRDMKTILCKGSDVRTYLLVADMNIDNEDVNREILINLSIDFTKAVDIDTGDEYLYDRDRGGFMYKVDKGGARLFVIE